MKRAMTEEVLEQETLAFQGRGGVSVESRSWGFCPAFRDSQTSVVYASRYADGRPAPCHLLDGLPDEVVLARDASGRAVAVKADVIAGFVRNGRFYTRDEASRQVSRGAPGVSSAS